MRTAEVVRNTKETQIRVKLNLDGSGAARLATGIPFLEHMLDQVARHGMIDLEIDAKGDLHIDAHHTVEDTAIVLGQALDRALFGGDPTSAPDLFRERSPITYVDAVRAPLLILAGENDSRCPIRQIWNYVARLRARGLEPSGERHAAPLTTRAFSPTYWRYLALAPPSPPRRRSRSRAGAWCLASAARQS